MFLCNLLMLNFVGRVSERFSSDGSSVKVIFVQVLLHSRTAHQYSSASLLNLP